MWTLEQVCVCVLNGYLPLSNSTLQTKSFDCFWLNKLGAGCSFFFPYPCHSRVDVASLCAPAVIYNRTLKAGLHLHYIDMLNVPERKGQSTTVLVQTEVRPHYMRNT